MKTKLVEQPKIKKLAIGEKAEKIKGKINTETKVVEIQMDRGKQSHFKNGCWAIPISLVNYICAEKFDLRILDIASKWRFFMSHNDIVYHGVDYGRDKLVELTKFDVEKAKNRTSIIRCEDITCPHNFGNQCVCGSISINAEGRCSKLD